jgi:hypothetical protein
VSDNNQALCDPCQACRRQRKGGPLLIFVSSSSDECGLGFSSNHGVVPALHLDPRCLSPLRVDTLLMTRTRCGVVIFGCAVISFMRLTHRTVTSCSASEKLPRLGVVEVTGSQYRGSRDAPVTTYYHVEIAPSLHVLLAFHNPAGHGHKLTLEMSNNAYSEDRRLTILGDASKPHLRQRVCFRCTCGHLVTNCCGYVEGSSLCKLRTYVCRRTSTSYDKRSET